MTWNHVSHVIGSILKFWDLLFRIFCHREVKSFSIHHILTLFQSILVIFGFRKFRKREFDEMKSYIKHTLTQCDGIIHPSRVISNHVTMFIFTPLDISLFYRSSNSGSSGCEIRIWKGEKFENVRKWMVYGTKIFIKIV